MPQANLFRLNRSGTLLAVIAAAFAGQASAAAGRVEFAVGPVNVVGSDGRTRPAARGTEVDTGDVVRTNDGRVQVRMTDGAYISLQPNTEFGIKDYKFTGKADGSESALYSLVKGAMRTVTGLIGRVNRNRYQVATPTATVGIRGTGGLIQVQNDGSTLVQGTSGIWFLANPAGSIDIPAGVSGVAPTDPKEPPKETTEVPAAGPSPLPPPPAFVPSDDKVLLSGDGYQVAFAYGVNFGQGAFAQTGLSATSATFNGDGQLTVFNALEGGFNLPATGTTVDFGTDGILAWGRWIGTVTANNTSQTYDGTQGLHYVVGLPTATLPQSGEATYTVLGATSPTFVDGGVSPGTFSGKLIVDFGLRSSGVKLDLNVGIGGNAYPIIGTAPLSGSTFQAFGILVNDANGVCGFCGCSAQVQGFFAGPSAERAGLGYQIDTSLNGQIVGAAAFKKQ